jgi:hypothetical protein
MLTRLLTDCRTCERNRTAGTSGADHALTRTDDYTQDAAEKAAAPIAHEPVITDHG